MKLYKFYDTDATGQEEYDISGGNYLKLVETCVKYCASVSFRIVGERTLLSDKFEQYRIPITTNVINAYSHYYHTFSQDAQIQIRHYRICPETYSMLLDITDSIFKWITGCGYNNPEDPVFYRADGSIFFSSIIHNGECTLIPAIGENIKDIISQEHWISYE